MEDSIKFYYGDSFIFENQRIPTGAYESKYVICPRCLKATILVKKYPEDSFHYDSQYDPYVKNATLDIGNDQEFCDHVNSCKPNFGGNGIYKCNSEELLDLGRRFNFISRLETEYIEMLILGSTYVYILDELPIAYISFIPSDSSKNPEKYIFSNAFTFHNYRKNNYATKLFQFAIDDLKLDVSELEYSPPLTLGGAKLLRKFATSKLFPMGMVGGHPTSADELNEYIKIHESKSKY